MRGGKTSFTGASDGEYAEELAVSRLLSLDLLIYRGNQPGLLFSEDGMMNLAETRKTIGKGYGLLFGIGLNW